MRGSRDDSPRKRKMEEAASRSAISRIAGVDLVAAVERLGVARTATLYDEPPYIVVAAYQRVTGKVLDLGMAATTESSAAAKEIWSWASGAGVSRERFAATIQALLGTDVKTTQRVVQEALDGDGISVCSG